MRKILLALLMMAFFAAPASANKFSVTGFAIDDNEQMSYKSLVEVATTDDTVTASESGKKFLIDNAGTALITMTLPTAAAGLTYEFNIVDAAAGRLELDAASTDTFVGCVSSSAASTFTAGDDLISPSSISTGDTITLTGASTKWYCSDRIGTWVDNN